MVDNGGTGTTAQLTIEFSRLLEPIGEAGTDLASGDGEHLERILRGAGITESTVGEQYAAIEGVVGDVGSAWSILQKEVINPLEADQPPTPEGISAAVTAIGDLFDTLGELEDLRFGDGTGLTVADGLIDYLIAAYFEEYHPDIYAYASLAGVVNERDNGTTEVDFSVVPDSISNPKEVPMRVLGWGTAGFKSYMLVKHLSSIQVAVSGIPGESSASLFDLTDEQRSDPNLGRELDVPIYSAMQSQDTNSSFVRLGLVLAPVPGDGGSKKRGLALAPYGEASLNETVILGNGWELSLEASADASQWALVAQPVGSSTEVGMKTLPGGWPVNPNALAAPGSSSGIPDFHGEVSLMPTAGDSNRVTAIGSEGSSGLFLDSVALTSVIDAGGDSVTVAVELPTEGRLAIQPEGGFLSKVLPPDLGVDFETLVGWSNLDGVYFEGGGTLEASIPMHIDLGFAGIEELYLALDPTAKDNDFTLEVATSPNISLGPLKSSVKRMGLRADISFPENRDGNMGLLDLDIGFRPPDGLALSVDTGPVTGGGFMIFEPEKNRYSGGLELQFSNWGLKVVGFLKTKLPGTDGFSLLLLVTADLPPIQLGFGFVMNGIGGLAGVHRGFKKKPLGKAVRSGNLDSVLFPEDVVENADQIITDLRAIFPPKADHHVFGPMLRLGWGTPVIITAELGVLVSVPSWKIALLGKFMVDLPDEKAPLIELNLAVVGVLDVPNQELAIDASLYDSRIVTWTVSGDMAMRLSWGDDSRFMLSVGGFHPRYDPPTSFPELDRVTAALAPPGGNPRLEYTGYLAVTPNTFQVGAGVVLHGEFGPAVVHGELSFDALFRFKPFSFVVDVYAGVSVKVKGMGLSLKLDGRLSGPGPYRVKGKLSIEIFFFSITVNVDAKFGDSGGKEELPTADVLPELASQLKQPANWSVQKPADGHQLVTLQDPDTDRDGESGEPQADVLLAHPLGTMAVRQQVVPLGVPIEKYGNAKPRHTTYELLELAVAGNDDNLAGQRQLREKFAPARFQEMSDSEKLQAAPFEQLPAGRTMDNGIVHYAGADNHSLLSWATLSFESSVIDEQNDQYRLDAGTVLSDLAVDPDRWDGRLGLALGHELAEGSAVATAETRTTGAAAYENLDASKRVGVGDQRYVVAWTDDLERVAFEGNPVDGQTRVEARQAHKEYLTGHDVAPDAMQVVGVHELGGGSGGDGP